MRAVAVVFLASSLVACNQVTPEGGTGGGSGSSSGGASSGGATCAGAVCTNGLTCCGTKCADLSSDTANCGSCGKVCPAGQICESSTCQSSPCQGGPTCAPGESCCGVHCCSASEVCCSVTMGASTWECFAADAGCPPGCTTPPCPISSKRYKKDIQYLGDAQREQLHEALLKLPLATFRYRSESEAARARLGFLVEDATSPACVADPGDRVDLYGYATMAVAAVQAQEREIEELRAEIARLRAERPASR